MEGAIGDLSDEHGLIRVKSGE